MKLLAGVITILAAAVLVGAGAIASAISSMPNNRQPGPYPGDVVMIAGVVIAIAPLLYFWFLPPKLPPPP